MDFNPAWYIPIAAFAGLIFIAFVGKRAGWFKLIGGTNELLREQNKELRNQNAFLKTEIEQLNSKHLDDTKQWQLRHEENVKEISTMKGQIDIIKNIPLAKIDESLEKLANSNEKIVSLLSTKAKIDAEDRDVLTNSNKHIWDEVNKINEE